MLLAVLTLAATLGSSPVRAEVSDSLAEELKGYVDTALSEGDTVAKRASLLTWGHFADEEERESIAEFKSADEPAVRLAAGLALWRAGGEEAKSFVLEELKNRSSLFTVLESELSVIPEGRERTILRELIETGEASHRKAAFRYLARQGGELYGLIGEYAAASEGSTRSAALDALRSSPRKRALDFVESDMLPANDSDIQIQGIELAGYISGFSGRVARANEVLEGALEHDNPDVVEKAGTRLIALHDRSGVEPLVELMARTDDVERKKRIARSLLEHDVSPPGERVRSLYKEVQLALKMKEKDSSGGGGGENEKEGGSGMPGPDRPADPELSELYLRLSAAAGGDEVFKKLQHMFGTTRFEKRLRATRALGYMERSKATDMLTEALFEGSEEMRLAAAKSLRRSADERALSSLERAISEERSTRVKVQVIRALGAIGTEDALRTLRFNSKTRNPEVRKAVISAVRDAGEKKGFETLRLYLGGRDLEIQWQAFLAALEIAPKKAMKRVDDIFRNPQDNFMRGVRTLSAERQELLIPELLTHGTRRVRTEAFRGARKIGAPMFGVFRDIAFDSGAPDDIRRRCLRLLANFRTEQDRSKFEQLAREAQSLEFTKLAIWTLAEYASPNLEATFRGLVTSENAMLKALGAYGLVRIETAGA